MRHDVWSRLPPGRWALAACLLATACAPTLSRNVRLADATPERGWTRVENVREVRQTDPEGCGAAALAMVLGHWGRPVTQDQIWFANPPPPGKGLRADTLRDYARGQGLEAFLVQGTPADLDREVGRNRPVLVGVLEPRGRKAYSHYEVVVGVHRERRRLLMLDPARGATEIALDDFEKEWDAAGRVTLVVFPAPSPD